MLHVLHVFTYSRLLSVSPTIIIFYIKIDSLAKDILRLNCATFHDSLIRHSRTDIDSNRVSRSREANAALLMQYGLQPTHSWVWLPILI